MSILGPATAAAMAAPAAAARKPSPQPIPDLREEILRSARLRRVTAAVVADEPGVIAGMAQAAREAEAIGVSFHELVRDGSVVAAGAEVARLAGTPLEAVRAEEVLLGALAKPSGIATRARAFVQRTGGRPRIVSGGWKKMPAAMKDLVRSAVTVGGASPRVLPVPFAYLDKNYVTLLGGVREALAAVAHLHGLARVVQVKGRCGDLADEACSAAEHGAAVVFVDTGRAEDVARVTDVLRSRGLRSRVQVAFGGGVTLEKLDALMALDLDIVDVGRAIVDAPLLDLRLDVLE